jgi:hypothetical protein
MNTKYTLSTLDSVPAKTTGSGTISSSGTVVTGTGTDFYLVGMNGWLVNIANTEVRKVVDINSATECIIDSPFTSDLSGADFEYIDKNDGKVQYVEIENVGGVDTQIDGVPFRANKIFTDGQINIVGNPTKFVRPVIIDGATSACDIRLTMFSNTQ